MNKLLSEPRRRRVLKSMICTLWGKNWDEMLSSQRVPINQLVEKLMRFEDEQKIAHADMVIGEDDSDRNEHSNPHDLQRQDNRNELRDEQRERNK